MSRKSALVLGAGLVGRVIARDLSSDLDVTIADRSEAALARAKAMEPRLETAVLDASDTAAITALARRFDVVCGALASHLGHGALKAVIAAGRPYCDISFMPENAWELSADAKAAGVVAVVDCGVAPGMSNLLCGWATRRLTEVEEVVIEVGGIPVVRQWPWEYKAGFAPADVLEEYTRPSRVVEGGVIRTVPALGNLERVDVAGVGTLEAFDTDGLRSLAYTLGPGGLGIPRMRERTLRWPGHVEKMATLRHLGLMGTAPVRVGDVEVAPRALLAQLLFPQWAYGEGEEDMTVMRVWAVGVLDGRRVRLQWDLLDRFDAASGSTSMSRTTAFPCAIVARMLAAGEAPWTKRAGVVVPETLGQEAGVAEEVMAQLQRRGVRYSEAVSPL